LNGISASKDGSGGVGGGEAEKGVLDEFLGRA